MMEDDAAAWAGWTVTGVQTLLATVYCTESVDDQWSWCVECECLIETTALAEHVRAAHPSRRR